LRSPHPCGSLVVGVFLRLRSRPTAGSLRGCGPPVADVPSPVRVAGGDREGFSFREGFTSN